MIFPVKMEMRPSPIVVRINPQDGRVRIAGQRHTLSVSAGVGRSVMEGEGLAIPAATEVRTAPIPMLDNAKIVVVLEEDGPL
jgi:hypothetical protein